MTDQIPDLVTLNYHVPNCACEVFEGGRVALSETCEGWTKIMQRHHAEVLTERTAERDRFRRLYDDQQLIDHLQIQRLVDALRGLLLDANPCVSPLNGCPGCPVCVAQDALEQAPGWAKYQPHNRDGVDHG